MIRESVMIMWFKEPGEFGPTREHDAERLTLGKKESQMTVYNSALYRAQFWCHPLGGAISEQKNSKMTPNVKRRNSDLQTCSVKASVRSWVVKKIPNLGSTTNSPTFDHDNYLCSS